MKSAIALSSSTTSMRIYRTMLGGQGKDRPGSLDHVARGEPRRRRATLHRAGPGVVHAAMAGTDDLAVLVADRAAGVGADGAERGERAVALTDDDVGLLVAGIGARGPLPGRQLARGADANGAARDRRGRRRAPRMRSRRGPRRAERPRPRSVGALRARGHPADPERGAAGC